MIIIANLLRNVGLRVALPNLQRLFSRRTISHQMSALSPISSSICRGVIGWYGSIAVLQILPLVDSQAPKMALKNTFNRNQKPIFSADREFNNFYL
jgi:hypothetical protein